MINVIFVSFCRDKCTWALFRRTDRAVGLIMVMVNFYDETYARFAGSIVKIQMAQNRRRYGVVVFWLHEGTVEQAGA